MSSHPPAALYSDQERHILRGCAKGHLLTHLSTLLFPPLSLSIARGFGVSLEELLPVAFPGYLLFGVLAPLAGLAADRWGEGRLLTLCLLLIGAGLLGAGLAPSPLLLGVGLAVVGAGASIYHPAGLALISQGVRARGRALGSNGVWGNLGIAGAPLCAGALALIGGWRLAFLVPGLVALSLWGWQLRHPLPRPSAAGVERSDDSPAHLQQLATGRKGYLALGLLLTSMCCTGIVFNVVTVGLPPALELQLATLLDALSRAPEEITFLASLSVSLLTLLGIPGQLWGGRLADRLSQPLLYLVFQSGAFVALLVMGLAHPLGLAVGAAAYMALGPGAQPIENSMVARLSRPEHRATTYGAKFIMSFGVGSLGIFGVQAAAAEGALQGVFLSVAPFGLVAAALAAMTWTVIRTPQVAEGRHGSGDVQGR